MGTGSSKTVTRKPSFKGKRRLSFKRANSVKDNQQKYTPNPEREPKYEPNSEPKVKPDDGPKPKPDSKPGQEPNINEKPVEDNLDVPTLTRKPSSKSKHRFSLKRKNSTKENKQKSTPNPDQDPISQPKIKPDQEPGAKSGEDPNMNEKPVEDGLDVPIDSRRRRSLSDGQLPVSIQQARDAQSQGQVRPRSQVEVAIPARDLNNVSRVGYLERKVDTDWVSSWFVLKDNTLYQYAQPIDDVTQDVLQLPGYEVLPCLPSGDRHLFELIHPEQAALMLSTDTVTDCELWMEAIHVATQKLTLDSLNLDMTNSVDQEEAKASRERLEEEARRQWQKELLRLKKQQLLREVLLQKEELTRKQNRFAKSKPNSFEGALPGFHPVDELDEIDEHYLRDRAILKQRKVSTQLKLEMVQKQMNASSLTRTKTKRKGFKLKKSEKPGLASELAALSPDQNMLEAQLKALTQELEIITKDLEKTERKSGSNSHLSTVSAASHRRQNFMMNSTASFDSGDSARERAHSDFSETRMNRSFASDPNLLHPTPTGSSISLRPDSVFSPDTPVHDQSIDSRVHLLSYTKQDSDIPMIDDSPSPQEQMSNRKSGSRHSWDLGAYAPFFLVSPPVGAGPPSTSHGMSTQNSGLNKSCDFSVLHTNFPVEDEVKGHGHSSGYGSSQHTVPRSKSETGCFQRNEISAAALAEIAAFEELVQKKMHLASPIQ